MLLTLQKAIIVSAFALTSTMAISGPSNVPFQATVTITDSIDRLGAAACLGQGQLGIFAGAGMTIGSGNATHLGRIAFVGNDCVWVNDTGSGYPKFYFSGPQGSLTITAANGDKLYGSYSGVFVATGETAVGGLVPYTLQDGQFSIVKGTGRFADAYASGSISGVETLNLTGKGLPSKGSISLTSKISY